MKANIVSEYIESRDQAQREQQARHDARMDAIHKELEERRNARAEARFWEEVDREAQQEPTEWADF